MIRFLVLLCVLLAGPVLAQEQAQEPVLQVEIEETEAIPGQPISMRVTILVPTFMPKPPDFPSLEAPNLLVRVASSGPTSQRISGETWAGISRRYLISPMVPGPVTLPAASVGITWANPEGGDPIQSIIDTDPFTIAGRVPEGAEGLDPFIAAEGLTLTQEIEGEGEGMAPGDSVIRTVTAQIEGTSPMFLPVLLGPQEVPGLRAYADEPVVEEVLNRGEASGTRTERVTFVAEGGGSGVAPEVVLEWYSLKSGEIETARLPEVPLSVIGPPVQTEDPRDYGAILRAVVIAALVIGVLVVLWRKLAPRVRAKFAEWRARWLASEAYAWRGLTRVLKARDHVKLGPALVLWASRVSGPNPRREPRLIAALTALGAARYGPHKADETQAWLTLRAVLHQVHQDRTIRTPKRSDLPPLNGAPAAD